ncbi:hypothetical protein TcG_08105 [Trypanosoma cruzi]|nr:hypothetical protein TcG_08105 [Trypanosoma cruzi]
MVTVATCGFHIFFVFFLVVHNERHCFLIYFFFAAGVLNPPLSSFSNKRVYLLGMGRGFGRGSRVAIVTHAQLKTAGKKTPRGLRGSRQKKRRRFQQKHDEQRKLEESLGMKTTNTSKSEKPLSQQVASIQFPHVVNKRQKGFRQLRRQIVDKVKDLRRRHAEKKKKQAMKSTNSSTQ